MGSVEVMMACLRGEFATGGLENVYREGNYDLTIVCDIVCGWRTKRCRLGEWYT